MAKCKSVGNIVTVGWVDLDPCVTLIFDLDL